LLCFCVIIVIAVAAMNIIVTIPIAIIGANHNTENGTRKLPNPIINDFIANNIAIDIGTDITAASMTGII